MFDWFQLSFQLDIWGWLYLIGVITIGGFVVGATGFGGGVVRVPLLLQLFSLRTIAPIENVLGFLNYSDLKTEILNKPKHKVLFPLAIGNVFGAAIGGYILVNFGTNVWLVRILGLVILLYQIRFLSNLLRYQPALNTIPKIPEEDLFTGHSGREFRTNYRQYFKLQNAGHALVGMISGVMSALFAIGGPPIVIYLERIIKDPQILRSTIALFFIINGFVQILVLFGSFQIDLRLLFTCIILFPFMTIGSYFGAKQARVMSHNEYKVWISVIIILASLFLIYRSFAGI